MSETFPVSADPLARLAEQQTWIPAKAEIAAQEAIRRVLGGDGPQGERIRDLLHGEWLHEPLHSIMTDVPTGSWTAAGVFDALAALSGSEKLDFAADASVILGLVGAAGAAITGMNDWAEVKREAPRKIGAVHALMNVAATVLYGVSLFERRRKGSRSAARAWGFAGLLVVSLSAHLGGNMIYEHGIGVQRGKRWQD